MITIMIIAVISIARCLKKDTCDSHETSGT